MFHDFDLDGKVRQSAFKRVQDHQKRCLRDGDMIKLETFFQMEVDVKLTVFNVLSYKIVCDTHNVEMAISRDEPNRF